MKRLYYVRKATLTLFEAYPDDPKKGWMPKCGWSTTTPWTARWRC